MALKKWIKYQTSHWSMDTWWVKDYFHDYYPIIFISETVQFWSARVSIDFKRIETTTLVEDLQHAKRIQQSEIWDWKVDKISNKSLKHGHMMDEILISIKQFKFIQMIMNGYVFYI
jgi:hypothetical protein